MTFTPTQRLLAALIALLLGGYWLFYLTTTQPRTFVSWQPGIPQSYDADMAYVYNSILPFEGHSYTHVYHPGTAMHVVGTIFAAFAYPLAQLQGVSLAAFHAADPFPLWTSLRLLLGIMGIVSSLMLFRHTLPRRTPEGLLLAFAVGIAYFAFYQFGFISLVSWAHASMGYTFGTLILLALFRIVHTNQPITRWHRWLLGTSAGVLTATAYYYAPFVLNMVIAVFVVMLIRERGFWRSAFAAVEVGIASLVGFMLINAPIWHKFDQFVGSVLRIATSTGVHGSGEQGFTTVADLVRGAQVLYEMYPSVFWGTGLAIGLWIVLAGLHYGRYRDHGALWGLPVGALAHILAAMFLIFKHPGGSYLNTFMPVIPLLLAFAFVVMDTPRQQRIAQGIALLVIALFVRQYINVIGLHREVTAQNQVRVDTIHTVVAAYAEQTQRSPDDILIITTYGSHFGCYGMMFGNGYTDYQLAHHTATTCPHLVEFKGGLDGAQATQRDWFALDDQRFCWDLAILPDYIDYENSLLANYAPPQPYPHAYYQVFTNDQRYTPQTRVRVEFDHAPCGNGWHAPQKSDDISYAWMSETESTLELTLTHDRDYTLTVGVFAAITPDVLATLTPHINNTPLTFIPGTTAGTFTTTIPADLIARNTHVTQIAFHIAETISPGIENGDPRQLGVAVDWIEIQPVEN